jgi:hypothetical protein
MEPGIDARGVRYTARDNAVNVAAGASARIDNEEATCV